jgi:hypothetical protein
MSLVSLFVLVMGGCASQQTETGKMDLPEVTAKIKPHRIYEECIQTMPNQLIEYTFQSSRPVDFNIHYHRDGEIFYPVLEQAAVTAEGDLNCHQAMAEMTGPSENPEYFCLMWENPHNRSVDLYFDYIVNDIEEMPDVENK